MALSFDATYYLNARPDVFHAFVATAGATGKTWPEFAEEHYNTFGRFEGANPNATFNTDEYLAANPDVAAAGVNPFTHYLHFGAAEGRAPSDSFPSFASFDSAAYLAANPDLGAAGIDTPNEAYAHFVIFGQFEDRPGAPAVDNGLPGTTYTLTPGADNFPGTKGNDTFNALTVNASGAAADTLTAFDKLDGGAGVDTLNIYTDSAGAGFNMSLPATASIKNVEIVNVYNAGAAAAFGDASKFEGVTELWQHAAAADVTNLAATTTAGFKAVEATVAADLDVSAAAAATSVKIALDGVKGAAATGGGETENRADIDVDGAALNTVTVSGTLAQKSAAAAAVQEVFTATFAGGMTAGDTVIFDGRTYTSGGGHGAAGEAAAFVAAYNDVSATWTAVDNLDGTVTFTKKTGGIVADVVSGDFTGTAAGQVTAAAPTTQGANALTGAAASLALNVTAGKDVETLTVNTEVATVLSVIEGAGTTKEVKTVDASASKGGVSYNGTVTSGANVSTIKTGAGADVVTIATATLKDNAATPADETVSALVETGAGNDTITVSTTGTGTTTVNAGEGNDKVDLTTDAGTGVLTVNLGAGDDTFSISGAGAVSATDVIDGGEGTDTLLLTAVGSANIGAFKNFEVFDAKGLNKTLDVDILASKNTVTEFIASGDTGAAILTNIGAGVGFRATGSVTSNLELTQKVAGDLTVTLDADAVSTTAQNDTSLNAKATNATSLKAVFDVDSGYVQNGANLNDQTITLTGTAASVLEVVSGGTNATNNLDYTIGKSTTTADGVLTSVTVSGSQALDLDFALAADATATKLASVDAAALTGALTFNLNDLKASAGTAFDGGVLTLGAGSDVITGVNGGVISGFGKGTAEDATLQGTFDILKIANAIQAGDIAANATITVKDGLLTFNGTGPATLDDAITLAATAANDANEAVVFEYIGNSYIYAQGGDHTVATDDVVIKLVGVTGLTGLDTVGLNTDLYVF